MTTETRLNPSAEADAAAKLASASPILASAVRRSLGLPLATKVRLVILLVSGITLLTVVTAVFLLQLQLFRGTFARDLEALAAIMAANSSAALDFDDPDAAIESLSALQSRPGIISATIMDSKGAVFAHFGREETAKSLAQFTRRKSFGTSGNEWLHTVPIVREGRSLGFFHLRADYAVCRNELLRASLGIMSGVLACSMILILLLTTRLQKFITRPIAQLAEAARDVARRNDYSVRVSKWADDELGQFTDAFNQMLGEVQRRDAELELQVDALAVSEARFRGVVENLGEALLLVGLDGETLSINPRFTALLGWKEEDLEGQNALEMLMPDAERCGLLLAKGDVVKDGTPLEARLQRRDGTLVWTEIHASTMHGPTGEIVGTLAAILDITARRQAAEELEETNKRLVDLSHAAGMAQVATGVLHNVGNVLNSVNLTATLSLQKLRDSKVGNFGKAAELIASKNGDLAEWLAHDPQGQKLPGYLTKLATRLTKENSELITDLDQLAKNVEHIKEIVSVQQNYAQVAGLIETMQASKLVEDAIRINSAKFVRHGIEVACDFSPVPAVKVDKHKTLQILVNLIRNAKHALEECNTRSRKVIISITGPHDGFVNVSVKDNGIGIPAENLTRIFQHGFTTRKHGHGFGLHSGALAAKEMGGSLGVHSDGYGTGSTFTLSLPIAATISLK